MDTVDSGLITDSGIDTLRKRIGIPQPLGRGSPFNTEACVDTMRHFANGYGDDNPLFGLEEYGAKSRWGACIAPPMYPETMGFSHTISLDDESKKILKGDPLSGVHAFWSGVEWEWWRPIVPGDRLHKFMTISDVIKKKSEFGGGRSVHILYKTIYSNQNWEPVCAASRIMINAERESATKAGKYADKKRPDYKPEDIAAIDKVYEDEVVRGSEPRYWEDVKEGDALPQKVKGPYLITDVISFHIGWGWGRYRVAPLRLGYLNRKRIPSFYSENEFGAPDVAQRCHWNDDFARTVGAPYAYDYGFMRDCWLVHLISDWMGDDAWLWKFEDSIRLFNFIGDTHWMNGNVVEKYKREDGGHAVVLEISGTNQDGDVTCPGRATILLPSREGGSPALPEPSHEVCRILEDIRGQSQEL